MRLTLTFFAALALAMPAVAQSQGDSMKPAPQPNTYCLGRFLVDLPNDAEIVEQTAEYRNRTYSIEKMARGAYQNMLSNMEKTLRNSKHKSEPSLLREISTTGDGDSATLIFRETPVDAYQYKVQSFKWTNGHVFSLKSYADDDRVGKALENSNRTLSELRYRDPKEIPTEPGFCIERGFFAGEPAMPHYERAEVSFRLREHPDVVVNASTWMVMKEDREGLLDRIDRKKGDTALIDLFNRIKVLRRGQHPVASMAAEEYLQSIPVGETFSTHMFRWETTGKYHDLYAPEIIVEFRTGKTKDFEERPPTLSDKQAIELFDSIVNSIRVRPVSSPTPSSEPSPNPVAPQSSLPLGTTAASLQSCPQTGLWECNADLAAGEKRRFFPQGMVLPSVIVRGPERSLWQKLKGEPTNTLTETTWTLVGYDAPGNVLS